MATSGTISKAYRGWTYTIAWSAEQSVANNTSTITCTHTLVCAAAYGLYIGSRSNTCTVDGTAVAFTSSAISTEGGATFTLGTTTHTVTHDSDGTKSVTITGVFNIQATLTGVYVGNITASDTVTLTAIPRASALTVPEGYGELGESETLTVTRYSTAFTHSIKYEYGNGNSFTGVGYIKADGTVSTSEVKHSGLTINWTPPKDMANKATTVPNVVVRFTITTYNGSTVVGSPSVYKYRKYYTIPTTSEFYPTCSVSVTDPMGYASTYGGYLQGLSKMQITVTPTPAYSSPIQSYDIRANNNKYTDMPATTGLVNVSDGTHSISATVTDARTRSGTGTASVTVIAYKKPTITALTAKRCDSDGTENEQGAYIKVVFKSKVYGLDSKNTAKYYLGYKKSSDSDYTAVSLDDYENNYAVSNGSYIFEADTSSSYDIEMYVTDTFGSGAPRTVTASTAATVIHFRADGSGVAFGKISEKADALESANPIYAEGGILADNLVFEETEILVEGDSDTYYPVHVDINDTTNAFYAHPATPTYLYLKKNLDSTFPSDWPDMHATRGASCALGWLFRYNGWDGNGYFCRTLYRSDPYTTLVSHIQGMTGAAKGVVVWLRGGGATYRFASNKQITAITPYLVSTDISTTSGYSVMIEPRTDLGNLGIYNLNAPIPPDSHTHEYATSVGCLGVPTAASRLDFYDSTADAATGNTLNRYGYILHDGTAFDISNISDNGGSSIRFGIAGEALIALLEDRFRPTNNDQQYLGDATYRWKTLYAVNGTINTSDRNQKENILPIDQKYIDLFDKLQPVTFDFKGSDHDRTHIGFISQDVKQSMDDIGLTDTDFAAYCRDVKMEVVEVTDYDNPILDDEGNPVLDENGDPTYHTKEVEQEVLDENGNPEYSYSLRYSEFIALNTQMIQKNRAEIAGLKEENTALRSELDELRQLINELKGVT